MTGFEGDLRADRILELSMRFGTTMSMRLEEITAVNKIAKMLSMNAMVVAARAGEAGKGFSLLAEEFKKLSTQIDVAVSSLQSQAHEELNELTSVSSAILQHAGRQRLMDLALNAIEIVDRNLYERTCDVRWWATDSAVVSCVESPSEDGCLLASRRLKVILDAYTVYLDLWVCDAAGHVIAAGRSDRYSGVLGLSVAHEQWFIEAMRLRSGDEFVAADVKRVAALDQAPAATYATAIREGGATRGKPVGVLGIHFDWQPQAQAVVEGVRLTEEERARSRVMILDQNYRVLASSSGGDALSEVFSLTSSPEPTGIFAKDGAIVGYARTPGYETYKGMGWYGCVLQGKQTPKISGDHATAASAQASSVALMPG